MDVKDLVDELSEAGVIASLIYNPDLAYHSGELTERHFSDPVNSVMYYAINRLVKKGVTTIDAINVLSVISENPKLEKMYKSVTIDSINEIISLGGAVARTSVPEYKLLTENVRQKAFRRKMFEKLKKCEALCFQEEEICIQQQIIEGVNEVIIDFSTTEDVGLLSESVDSLYSGIKKNKECGAFLDFPIAEINKYCRLSKKETIIYSAAQKTGKSIWMMNVAKRLLDNNEIILYIDTEISDEKFFMRFLSHLSQVKYKSIEDVEFTDEEQKRIDSALDYLKSKKIIHVEMPVLDDVRLINTSNRMKDKYGITAIIIDYIKANGKYAMDAYQNSAYLGQIVDVVHTLASTLDVYTLGCVQCGEDGKVAYSKNIARNCSTLINMQHKTSKEILEDGGIEFGNMKFKVTDNRNGMEHMDNEYVSVGFNGNMCTFYDCKQPVRAEPF